jgi:hypothetical protein
MVCESLLIDPRHSGWGGHADKLLQRDLLEVPPNEGLLERFPRTCGYTQLRAKGTQLPVGHDEVACSHLEQLLSERQLKGHTLV